MSHYRRDVVGRGISTGLGLGLRRRLSGGALPVLFGWNPETAQALPATSTFTRASIAQVLTTTDGTTNWYQEAKSGEVRLDGLRRVENLIDEDVIDWSTATQGAGSPPVLTDNFSTDPGGEATAVRAEMDPGGTGAGDRSRLLVQTFSIPSSPAVSASVWLKLNSGTSSDIIMLVFAPGATQITLTVTDSWQRFAVDSDQPDANPTFELRAQGTLNGGSDVDLLIADGSNYGPQLEPIQSNSDAPSDFVNKDTEYLNIGVNGVRYFATDNGNSVDGSGVVTEAAGTTITGGGYLPEPAATNTFVTVDLSDAAWSKSSATINDDGVNSLGLHQYTIVAAAGFGIHGVSESTDNGACSTYCIAKEGAARYLIVGKGATAASDFACFDLQNGVITEEGGGIDDALITSLGDGWYKCEVSTSDTSNFCRLTISDTGTPGNYNYAFTGAGETILTCHVQNELTAYSTSPIITSGSTVTRVADVLSDSTVIAAPFSIFFDITGPQFSSIRHIAGFNNSNDRIRFDADNQMRVVKDDLNIAPLKTSGDWLGERVKGAINFEDNNGIFAVSGASTAFDGACTLTSITSLGIGMRGPANDRQLTSRIHSFIVYGTAQTQAQLEALVA